MLNSKCLVIKFIVTAGLLIFCSFSNGCEKSSNKASASDETIKAGSESSPEPENPMSLFDDQVSFVPPVNFKALPIDKLKEKMPENGIPGYVFSNSEQTGLVLVYLDELDGNPLDITEVKNFVEKAHQSYSSWITSEITEINGNQWFYFEWKEPEKDDSQLVAPVPPEGETPVPTPDSSSSHYKEFATSIGNKLLRFVFKADVKEFDQFKNAFTESSRTIKINKK